MQWSDFLPAIRHLSARDQKRVREGYELGIRLHGGQKRKSGEPYFTHPITVAKMLAHIGADADTIIAALLHDAVEDTPITLQEIDQLFNGQVATLIDGVTKIPDEALEHPQLNEQVETLRKMFTLMQQDVRIMIIKLYDRLHNMQTIGALSEERQATFAEETQEVYAKIAGKLCMQDVQNELDELSLHILNREEMDRIRTLRMHNSEQAEHAAEHMDQELRGKFSALMRHVRLHFEPKTIEKLRTQIHLEGAATGQSPFTIVCVTEDIPQCYQVLGALHQLWRRETLSFQDFINAPQLNGYQGLHTTIILSDGTRVRCKIRTHDMDAYARRGIATLCFQGKAPGLVHILPWTKRISSLAQDTQGSSDDFWETLRNDILGESITIHGPGDEAVLLPHGATALDGVFYLFGDMGLNTQTIIVNGKQTEFGDTLSNASSMQAEFTDEPTVHFSWLQDTHTGYASALIHQGLAHGPPEERRASGKRLLDTEMRKAGKVGVDELTQDTLRTLLDTFAQKDLNELYENIATGKLDALRIARTLFPPREKTIQKPALWTLIVHFPLQKAERVLHMANGFPIVRLSLKRSLQGGNLRATLQMTGPLADELRDTLHSFLPVESWTLTRTRSSVWVWAGIISLTLLWGLDPVVAQALLQSGVTPIDLTLVRFLTFAATSSVLLAAQYAFAPQRFRSLNPAQPSLILSAVALFLTALLSYYALTFIQPTEYILFIVAGLMLTMYVRSRLEHRASGSTFMMLVVLSGIIAFLSLIQRFSLLGTLFATGSALSFALYSRVSRQYQEDIAVIRARYPAFLFWISLLCGLFSLLLIPFSNVSLESPLHLSLTVLFVLIFAIFPYGLYFEVMRRAEGKLLDRALPFVCLSTLIGEIFFTGSPVLIVILPLLVLALWRYGLRAGPSSS